MAKIWEPQPTDVYKNWVDTILDEASDELTDWEINFIESINNQLVSGRTLSQKQADIVERIYAEKTS